MIMMMMMIMIMRPKSDTMVAGAGIATPLVIVQFML